MAESGIPPQIYDRPSGELGRLPSRVVITDEMMLKAVTMANEKDKAESKLQSIQHGIRKPDDEGDMNRMNDDDDMLTNKAANSNIPNDSNKNGKFEENCPFDIICDFLQAIMQKKYEEALTLCQTILMYEPQNEIANEFRDVLLEMVADAGLEPEEVQQEESGGNEDETSSNSSDEPDAEGGGDGGTSSSSSSGGEDIYGGDGGDGDRLLNFFDLNDSSDSSPSEDSEEEEEDTEGTSSAASSIDDSYEEESEESESEDSPSSGVSENEEDTADLFPMVVGDYDHADENLETSDVEETPDDTFDMISSMVDECDFFSIYAGVTPTTEIEDLGLFEEQEET